MATLAFEDRSFSLSRVFSRTFGVIGRNPAVIFGIAFLFGALPSAIFSLLLQQMIVPLNPQQPDLALASRVIIVSGIGGIIAFVLGSLVQGALVSAAVAESEGRRARFGQCLASGLNRLLPLLAVGILYGLAVGFGTLLLIVPGAILAVMWAVATPAVVAERLGVGDAFSRSAALTAGARWKIFGLFLVVIVIVLLISWAIGLLVTSASLALSPGAGAFSPIAFVFNIALRTLTTAVWATFLSSLYVELRLWKDGPMTDMLSDIFR